MMERKGGKKENIIRRAYEGCKTRMDRPVWKRGITICICTVDTYKGQM
jgi:hypothetical protein